MQSNSRCSKSVNGLQCVLAPHLRLKKHEFPGKRVELQPLQHAPVLVGEIPETVPDPAPSRVQSARPHRVPSLPVTDRPNTSPFPGSPVRSVKRQDRKPTPPRMKMNSDEDELSQQLSQQSLDGKSFLFSLL